MNTEEILETITRELRKVIIGQDELLTLALTGLFSGGHLLIEGVPGTAKTLMVKTLAATLDMRSGRVQMTPDLLPADILGSSIYREQSGAFEFQPGPIFTNFLLADEINRASGRTQSAMLEAMQELHVTYGGVRHPLPDPFFVFATQNPVEQEGTYPLPAAQLDRFMFKVIVDHPGGEDEEEIYRRHHMHRMQQDLVQLGVERVLDGQDVLRVRQVILETFVREEVFQYVRRLVEATRRDELLSMGASPRAGIMLIMGAKSMARFAGRDFVTPDDIKRVVLPGLRHRIILSPAAELEGVTADSVLENIMDIVEVPR